MLWTLILSMTIWTQSGASTHTVTVPNISSKDACRLVGQQHVDKFTAQWPHMRNTFSAVYTCVEQGKINGL